MGFILQVNPALYIAEARYLQAIKSFLGKLIYLIKDKKDFLINPHAQKTREWPTIPRPSRRPYTCFFSFPPVLILNFVLLETDIFLSDKF